MECKRAGTDHPDIILRAMHVLGHSGTWVKALIKEPSRAHTPNITIHESLSIMRSRNLRKEQEATAEGCAAQFKAAYLGLKAHSTGGPGEGKPEVVFQEVTQELLGVIKHGDLALHEINSQLAHVAETSLQGFERANQIPAPFLTHLEEERQQIQPVHLHCNYIYISGFQFRIHGVPEVAESEFCGLIH